jgi:protein phosphatase
MNEDRRAAVWKDVAYFSKTDVGVKRSHNQDAFGVLLARAESVWEKRGHIFIVADGMGAHAVGELASKMAVEIVEHTYPRLKAESPAAALADAYDRANEAIHEKGNQNPEFKGMGTTATTLVLRPEGAYIAHVGDSRCYRIRKDRIEQLTFDHSLQWEIARQRRVPPEQLDTIPTNVIVRSLGPQPETRPDSAGPYPVARGDRFILCSDGLSGPVKDDEIWAAANHLDGETACQFLVDLANLRGGLDNITLVLVAVGDAGAPEGGERAFSWPRFLQRMTRLAARIPVEWWYFLGGVATAGAGSLLLRYGNATLNFASMLVALSLLGVALWLSVRRRRLAKEKAAGEADVPNPTPIHRTRECTLDRAAVDLVAKEEQRLRELAIEQNWRVAWDEAAPVCKAAQDALEKADLPEAYRLYCKAVSLLSVGMRLFQDKHEVLIPQWDRFRK